MPSEERSTGREAGFTLVEMMAALGLAVVLAGVGVVELPAVLHGVRLAAASRTVATTLRLARGRALARGTTVEVRLGASGMLETRSLSGDVIARHTLPAGVVLTDFGRHGRVRFGALGTAENVTVRLAAGGQTRTVVVNQRGRVRLP